MSSFKLKDFFIRWSIDVGSEYHLRCQKERHAELKTHVAHMVDVNGSLIAWLEIEIEAGCKHRDDLNV